MSAREGDAQARSTAAAVARRSYGKLVAFLAARTRDMAAAEDALAEAFAAALADWPQKGGPANPEAWLLTSPGARPSTWPDDSAAARPPRRSCSFSRQGSMRPPSRRSRTIASP